MKKERDLKLRLRGSLVDVEAAWGPALLGLDLRAPDRGDYGHSADSKGSVKVVRESGRDDLGPWRGLRLRRRWNTAGGDASLELRAHQGRGSLLAWVLPGTREPLKSESGLRVSFLEFPGLQRCLGFHRPSFWWTSPVFASSPRNMPSPCQAFLWEAGRKRYGALLPLCGEGLKGELSVWDNVLGVDLSAFMHGHRVRRAPAFALALAEDPYAALDAAFDAAASAMAGTLSRRRPGDSLPEVFEHLGWCSWNTYYQSVSADKLLRSAASLRRRGVPAAWALIDDGWSQLGRGSRRHMLWDYDADKKKFPGGLEPCVRQLKRRFGFRWVGVWHAFQGYWNGIAPGSPLARRLKGKLIPAPKEGSTNFLPSGGDFLIPDPLEGRGEAFYDGWYKRLASQGVDFVKVDNQGSVPRTVQGRIPVFEASEGQRRNLLRAVDRHLGGNIIHCMGMSTESSFSWRRTAVARNSDDYIPGQRLNPLDHAFQNAYNSLWMSRISFPDFDMWESGHKHAEFHAALRAVSGGPIYITDRAGEENGALLRSLCDSRGRIYRADQAGQPSPDCLFRSPHEQRIPLKIFNRVGETGILACFNANRAEAPVSGNLSLADLPGLKAGTYFVYDWKSGEGRLLRSGKGISLDLPSFGWRLFFFVPLTRGFAPVGLKDKRLSPRSIEEWDGNNAGESLILREGGPFVFHSSWKPQRVLAQGRPLKLVPQGPGKDSYVVNVPGKTRIRLEILR